MSEKPDTEVMMGLNAGVVEEFRTNGGKVGGQFESFTLLLLTTTGAKSGQPRLSPLAYHTVDDKMLIIGSYGGADIDPAWVHNLRANPAAHVEVDTTDWDVSARELPPTERDDAFAKILAAAPGFSENLANTSRVIPIFELQSASA
jgi:deazaflavin-dependent oxidoreductase (nitroreductase family)